MIHETLASNIVKPVHTTIAGLSHWLGQLDICRSADLLDKSQRLEEWFELKDQGAGEADGQDTERRFIVLATSPATKESRGD